MPTTHAFADNSVLIAGRFFYRFDNEDQLNAHLKKVAPHWERIELPESFPCLVRLEVDDDGNIFPEFFTTADLQAMINALKSTPALAAHE